jgi:phosphate transport system substrate-binding protein
VRNASGQFVEPSIASITAAAEGANLPPTSDYRVSIVNAPGAQAYPISSFTWLLVYRNPADTAKGRKLNDFLKWALTEGEESAAALDYAPLPEALSRQLLARIDSIRAGSKS